MLAKPPLCCAVWTVGVWSLTAVFSRKCVYELIITLWEVGAGALVSGGHWRVWTVDSMF